MHLQRDHFLQTNKLLCGQKHVVDRGLADGKQ